jgi:hypothetical protein
MLRLAPVRAAMGASVVRAARRHAVGTGASGGRVRALAPKTCNIWHRLQAASPPEFDRFTLTACDAGPLYVTVSRCDAACPYEETSTPR